MFETECFNHSKNDTEDRGRTRLKGRILYAILSRHETAEYLRGCRSSMTSLFISQGAGSYSLHTDRSGALELCMKFPFLMALLRFANNIVIVMTEVFDGLSI